MTAKVRNVLMWSLISVGAVAVVLIQMLMNGTGAKVIERIRTPRPAIIAGEPDVLALLKEPMKRAQGKGKIPVIRFNLVNCSVCERVSRDVFTKPEWSQFARDRLDITDFLMPTTFTSEQPEMVQRIHLLEALAKAAGADQGFPLIAVLGRDGSLLGARAGYHAGGAENYVRWVEALSHADKSPNWPVNPVPEVPATNATAMGNTLPQSTNQPVPVTNSVEVASKPAEPVAPPVEVVVKGVSGAGHKRVVLLGVGKRNFPLVIGEKKRVAHDNGFAVVECREIGDAAVVVHVEGEESDRKLPLPLP